MTERLKISRLSVSLTRLNSTKEFFSLKIYCKIDFAACLWRCSLTSMISHSLLLTSLPPTIVITFYYFIRDILRSPSENFFIFSLLSCLQREIKTFFHLPFGVEKVCSIAQKLETIISTMVVKFSGNLNINIFMHHFVIP